MFPKSILMIPAVCWIEKPVARENNLNQWFTVAHDNVLRERKLYSLILIYEMYNGLISELLAF